VRSAIITDAAEPLPLTSKAAAFKTFFATGRGANWGNSSSRPALLAAQCFSTGQAPQWGAAGEQIRAPSSIMAWLKSPG
jgi:hypothetical protein